MELRVHPSWYDSVVKECDQPYFASLVSFVRHAYSTQEVYPDPGRIFAALDACPLDAVRVVILGQDPYHAPGQAHGLAFSVPDGVPIPPSLRNIYAEIATDLGVTPLPTGDLTRWVSQGVLLLNATLTVQAHCAGSHQGAGWESFTDAVIRIVNERTSGVVFMLWGSYAQRKGAFIDRDKHLVLTSVHPSPLSAYRGFLGCRHFSQANAYLQQHGHTPIDWR